MIVLDASVLIAYLDRDDAHHHAASAALERQLDDALVVNPLTLAEVLGGPTRVGRLDDVRAVIDALEIDEVPFPDDTAARLARLRVESGLRLPDCGVLLAAQERSARVASFDAGVLAAATRLGVGTVEL